MKVYTIAPKGISGSVDGSPHNHHNSAFCIKKETEVANKIPLTSLHIILFYFPWIKFSVKISVRCDLNLL